MKSIIISGSRNWTDERVITDLLERQPLGTVVIVGGAKGADTIAAEIVKEFISWNYESLSLLEMPAPWDARGKAAGPERNEAMLAVLRCLRFCGYEVEVHVFPLTGSKGTYHMKEIAERKDIPTFNHGANCK